MRIWIPLLLTSMMMLTAPALANKPNEMTFGGGVGWQLAPGSSQDLLQLNFASAKVRLDEGLQVEPFVTLGTNRGSEIIDDGTDDVENLESATFIGLGALAKYPLKSSATMDLHGIGGATLSTSRSSDDPAGDNNEVITGTTVATIEYGGGIEWWFKPQLSLSVTATNPLITFINQNTTQETGGDDVEEINRDVGVQVTWNPTVTTSVNLWFN